MKISYLWWNVIKFGLYLVFIKDNNLRHHSTAIDAIRHHSTPFDAFDAFNVE